MSHQINRKSELPFEYQKGLIHKRKNRGINCDNVIHVSGLIFISTPRLNKIITECELKLQTFLLTNPAKAAKPMSEERHEGVILCEQLEALLDEAVRRDDCEREGGKRYV